VTPIGQQEWVNHSSGVYKYLLIFDIEGIPLARIVSVIAKNNFCHADLVLTGE